MANSVHLAQFPRQEETFPTLTAKEIERLRRFGLRRKYANGEKLFQTGDRGPACSWCCRAWWRSRSATGWATLRRSPSRARVSSSPRSGSSPTAPRWSTRMAEGDVETLLISPEGVRALLVAEAELGERIMRALILRRVSLIESGAGGPVLIGATSSWDVVRLQDFLGRNSYPHHILDPQRP